MGVEVLNRGEAHPARPDALDLDDAGNSHRGLVAAAAIASDGIVAGPVRDRPLNDFDEPGQGVALRLSNGAAELGTEQPSRLNRIEPESPHQLLRRISVGMGGNQIRRPQPGADREIGAVDPPSPQSSRAAAAGGTLRSEQVAGDFPSLVAAVHRPAKHFWPARRYQVCAARLLVGELMLELDERAGKSAMTGALTVWVMFGSARPKSFCYHVSQRRKQGGKPLTRFPSAGGTAISPTSRFPSLASLVNRKSHGKVIWEQEGR